MPRTRKKSWSKSVGGYGYRVRLVARGADGRLSLRWWSPGKKDYEERALGHCDREQGEFEAKQVSAALLTATQAAHRGGLTVGQLLSRYEREATPNKTPVQQREDTRRLNMWIHVLGAGADITTIDSGKLDEFVTRRRAGTIEVPGHKLQRKVSARSIIADVGFLQTVFRWAEQLRTADGKPYLPDNAIRSYTKPSQPTPRRPVATYDRFLKVREHCDSVDPQRLFGGFMDLVEALGWRESALCQLWASDVDRARHQEHYPHGRIRKRWQTDKEGVEMWVPLSAGAREALDRLIELRPAVGDTWLFPAPRAFGKCWNRWHARAVLERAEAKAELPKIFGGDFHPYRRKWATERKHLAVTDVAEAGGWKTSRTLELCYYKPDPATLLAVVTEPRKLREAKAL
jgi:hypothetical protein